MRPKLCLLLFYLLHLLLLHQCVQAQTVEYPCAASEMQRRVFDQNPHQLQQQQRVDEQIHQQLLRNPAGSLRSVTPFSLPVVVHVVHQNGSENIDDAQVQRAIQHLNDAFAHQGFYADAGTGVKIPVQFCLAQRTPNNGNTSGITRTQSPLTTMTMETQDQALKDLARWDTRQYINIWVVADINSISIGSGVAGYAYYASAHGASFDGIVCESRYFGKNPANDVVLIHEMGHYLNLYHTFEGGCTNNFCDLEGDRVCDTPPDQAKHTGCLYNSCTTDAQDTRALNPLRTDVDDFTQNYMDYSPFSCQHAFTTGQADRMLAALQTVRASLLESPGCLAPCTTAITADFTFPTELLTGASIPFQYSGTGGSSFEWKINGKVVANQRNFSYVFTQPGAYTVELVAMGASPNCRANYKQQVQVSCNVLAQFNNSLLEVKEGESLRFQSSSTGATNLKWRIDGTEVGTGTQLDYGFNQIKDYLVVLEASNAYCSATASGLVKVKSPCGDSAQQYYYRSDQMYQLMNYSLPDGGLLCVGKALATNQLMVIRLQSNGTLKWARKAVDIGPGTSQGFALLEDGNYALLFSNGSQANATLTKMTPDGTVLWTKQYPFSVWGVQVYAASGGKMLIHSVNQLFMVDKDGNQLWNKTLANRIFASTVKRNDNSFFVMMSDWQVLIVDENGQVKLSKKLDFPFDGSRNYPVCLPDNGIAMVMNDKTSTYLIRLDNNLEVLWARRMASLDFNANIGASKTGDLLFAFNRQRKLNFTAISAEGTKLWTVLSTAGRSRQSVFPASAYRGGWAASVLGAEQMYIHQFPTLGIPTSCYFSPDTLSMNVVSMRTIPGNFKFEDVPLVQPLSPSLAFTSHQVNAIADCRTPINCPVACGDSIAQNFYQAEVNYLLRPFPLRNGGRVLLGRGNASPHVLMSKLDKDGSVLWTKRFFSATFGNDAFFTELSDGAMAIGITTQANGVTLLKMNRDGQVLWSKLISTRLPIIKALHSNKNDDFFVQTAQSLYHLDSNGNLLWSKSVSSPNQFTGSLLKPDGQLICSIHNNNVRAFVLLDKNGNILLQKAVPNNGQNAQDALALLADGGFVAPMQPDLAKKSVLILRFDAALNVIWSKSTAFFGSNVTLNTNSNGLIMVGTAINRNTLTVFSPDGTFVWSSLVNVGENANLLNGNSYADEWMINLQSTLGVYHLIIPSVELPQGCYFTRAENNFRPDSITSFVSSERLIDEFSSTSNLNLGVENDILSRSLKCKTYRPCPEICDNGKDDNGDGFIDCADPSCACNDCTQLADGLISMLDSVQCFGDSLKVYLRICNQGQQTLSAFTPIAFYGSNPTLSNATPLASLQRIGIAVKPDSCIRRSFSLKIPAFDSVFAVLNDDYSRPRPYNLEQFPEEPQTECSYLNNLLKFHYQPPAVMTLSLGPDQLVCDNSVIQLRATRGFRRYRWSDGSTDTTFTTFSPGLYWLDAWDACNRLHSDTVRLNLQNLGKVDLGPDRSICAGDSLTLSINGFDQVNWWPNQKLRCSDCKTITIKPDSTSLYYVIARTGNCFTGDSLRIQVEPKPSVQVLPPDTLTCNRKTVILRTQAQSPNTKISWLDPQRKVLVEPNPQVSQAGEYLLIVQPERGMCQDRISVKVVKDSLPPQFDLGPDLKGCQGDSIRLSAGLNANSIAYEWNTGSSSVQILVRNSGQYQLLVKGTNGCTAIDSVKVQFVLRPTLNLGTNRDTCAGSTLHLGTIPEAGVDYTWNTGGTGSTLSVNSSGQYILRGANGACLSQDTIQVRMFELPVFSLGPDTIVCAGKSIRLAPLKPITGDYLWSTGQSTANIDIVEEGTYSLRIRHNACEWRDTVLISSDDCFRFSVYVPNAFSPSGTANAAFHPFFSSQTVILDYHFQIYDRWGNAVFETKDPDQHWKGDRNRAACNQGVYVWLLNLRYKDNKGKEATSVKAGEVLLLR